jgi:hypothetical protein
MKLACMNMEVNTESYEMDEYKMAFSDVHLCLIEWTAYD